MGRIGWLAAIMLVTGGCGRGSAGQGGAADSTAVAAPPGAATTADTGARMKGAAPTKVPAKPTDSIIGYDSAFGPSFTVDSTGKIVPIVKKKKKP